MVMAEEHGMYKGLAPGERERGVKNNGVVLIQGRASLVCQCCNSKVLDCIILLLQPISLFLPHSGNAQCGHDTDQVISQANKRLIFSLTQVMVKFIAFQCQKGLLAAMWEKKRKPWHLKQMYPKPLFCMASHDCKLKITQEKESEKTKALKKSVFIPLGWSL